MAPHGAAAAAVLTAAVVLAGCSGGERQDAAEPSGTYKVRLVRASFPRLQGLGETAPFRLTVRNAGTETVPNLTLTVDGFANPDAVPGAADPERPIWVINTGPVGGRTAYVNTWAMGPLPPGALRTYSWSVTSLVPGTHTLSYRADAGLNGKARAQTPAGRAPEGSLTVRVTRRARQSTVDPKTGAVIYKGE